MASPKTKTPARSGERRVGKGSALRGLTVAYASDLGPSAAPMAILQRHRDASALSRAVGRTMSFRVDVDPDGAVTGLPYGTRKRIEVVRALMSNPRLLILDEPAAGLNPRETAELSAFLKTATADGLTLLVVEHDMAFVHGLCDHTVVLNFGRLIYDGPTQGVQADPAVREAYLGTRSVPAVGGGRAA